jgi:hypothetical protein
MAASMPVSRPRRKSGAVTSCPKDTGGAELHKRSAEASGFDRTARLGKNRAQREDALAGGVSWSRKDDDE